MCIVTLQRNGTLTDVSTIYTGETGFEYFGLMDKLNGLDNLPYWPDKPCSNMRGSEGSFFPPRHFTNQDVVHLYDKDICRILPLKYRRTETKNGKYL